jgi:hypothetical protein
MRNKSNRSQFSRLGTDGRRPARQERGVRAAHLWCEDSELGFTFVKDRTNGACFIWVRGLGRLLVIVPLTQKPDAILMGLTKRVKARASRSLALTRLLNPALCSQLRGVCRGLSRMAKPPRSGATQWHPLQHTTDTQQSIKHFGEGTADTKVHPKPLFFAYAKPNYEEVSTVVSPSSDPCLWYEFQPM